MLAPCEYNLKTEINDKNVYFYAEMATVFHLFKFKAFIENSEYKIKLIIFGKGIPLKFNKKKYSEKKLKKRHKDKLDFLNKDFLVYCISYFKEIIALLKPKYIYIDGTYGLYDPAQTGLLCGFISIFSQVVKRDYLHINLQPDFKDQIIDIDANVYGRFILFSVVLKTFKFIMKDEVREVLIEKS